MEALLLTNYLSDDEARSVLLRFQGDRLMNQNDRLFSSDNFKEILQSKRPLLLETIVIWGMEEVEV